MGGCATLVLIALVVGAEALFPLKQNYCRNRKPSECCRGNRDDDCTVPIHDTVCYCDDFCLDTSDRVAGSDDCCPDFREVCLGIKPPSPLISTKKPDIQERKLTEESVCYYKGGPLTTGVHIFNCNKCTCQDGQPNCEHDQCLVDEETIDEVNRDPLRYRWTASNYSMFWGRKAREGLTLRTGTFLSDDRTRAILPIRIRPNPRLIPPEFDARVEWRDLISGVRDQGWCGASWAFSTIGVAQDRHMILTGDLSVSLAPQQLLSCSSKTGNCQGGYIDHAWMFMRKLGVVEESCYGYQSGRFSGVPPCERSPRFSACKVYKTEPAYRISSKVQDIQWEIKNNGPVQAVMAVHRDFFMYSSGVYQCPTTNTGDTSLHSVRILGWGEDATHGNKPIKYWLVANSWGTEWGENGLFRIQQGAGDASCGIEDFVLAVRGRRDRYG